MFPFLSAHSATYPVPAKELSALFAQYPQLIFEGSQFGTTLFGWLPYLWLILLAGKLLGHLVPSWRTRSGGIDARDAALLAFCAVFFLLLNFFVSACATVSVLYLWDQLRSPVAGGIIPPIGQILRPPPDPTATPTPQDTPTPAPTPTPSFTFHTVQSGETFDSIATEYSIRLFRKIAFQQIQKIQLKGHQRWI